MLRYEKLIISENIKWEIVGCQVKFQFSFKLKSLCFQLSVSAKLSFLWVWQFKYLMESYPQCVLIDMISVSDFSLYFPWRFRLCRCGEQGTLQTRNSHENRKYQQKPYHGGSGQTLGRRETGSGPPSATLCSWVPRKRIRGWKGSDTPSTFSHWYVTWFTLEL